MTSRFDETEHPRHRDGQFARKRNSAPSGALTLAGSLADASPVDIDTALADIYQQRSDVLARVERSARTIRQMMANSRGIRRHPDSGADLTQEELSTAEEAASTHGLHSYLRTQLATYKDGKAKLEALDAEEAPLSAEFARRPWSRFFLVPGGHIHSSMGCSTCNRGRKRTLFSWLPDLSGRTEAEAVAEHGALLCTTCYPSAPVEWTNHYELEAQRKAAESCPGSGTNDWLDGEVRTGFAAGNGGTCRHCGAWVSTTSRFNTTIRKHKPAPASGGGA